MMMFPTQLQGIHNPTPRNHTMLRTTVCSALMLLTATAGLTVAGEAAAEVPMMLSHQGRILDTERNPIGGIEMLTFAMYDGPESNTVLWSETLSVSLDNGYYTLMLGRTANIPENIFDGATVYLGIRVGNDDELRPRIRISSVPYAFKAATADNATGDITPQTVSVGGTTVIDEQGRWTGDPTGLVGPEGPAGAPGADADPADVAMALGADSMFRDALAMAVVNT